MEALSTMREVRRSFATASPQRRIIFFGAACLVLAITDSAVAQSSSAELNDAAKQVIEEAAVAASQKEFALCKTKMEGVWATVKHPKVAGLLGTCEDELGLSRAAAEHLDFYLRHDDGSDPERTARIRARFDAAKKRIGTVSITCSVPGTQISVDGMPVGTVPLILFLEPGPHRVTAQKDALSGEQRFDAAAGSSAQITIVLRPSDGGPVQPPPTEKPLWPAFLMGGFGVAALGFGIGTQVAAASADSDAASFVAQLESGACADRAFCEAEAQSAADSRGTMQSIAVVTFIGAGALAAATVTYLLVPIENEQDADVRVVPAASAEAAGLWLRGRF